MKLLFVVLLIVFCQFLLCQPILEETLPCLSNNDGYIAFDQVNTVLLVSSNEGGCYVGDGWSEIWFCQFVGYGFISFSTPSIPEGYQIMSAMLICYVGGFYGDDESNTPPIFQLPLGTITPEFFITHVDYGMSLDASDIYPNILHPYATLANPYSIGWKTLDVTNWLIDDIQNNRALSQYMLSLQYSSDWDLSDDWAAIHAAGFPTSPYILIEYELIPVPPVIEHEQLASISNELLPMTMSATITDDTGISSVFLTYKINNQADTTIVMENTFENLYECTFNPALPSSGGHFYYKIYAIDLNNNTSAVPDSGWFDIEFTPTSNVDPSAQSTIYEILQNYPNPFNPETTIIFFLPEAGITELCIYNLKGQMLRRLINAPLSVGTHRLVWDGKDDHNTPVASGIYLYRLQSGKHKFSGKMVLAK